MISEMMTEKTGCSLAPKRIWKENNLTLSANPTEKSLLCTSRFAFAAAAAAAVYLQGIVSKNVLLVFIFCSLSINYIRTWTQVNTRDKMFVVLKSTGLFVHLSRKRAAISVRNKCYDFVILLILCCTKCIFKVLKFEDESREVHHCSVISCFEGGFSI